MNEDPRKTGLKNGLRQLNREQLARVIEYRGEMCLDSLNYDGNFCPLAVAVGMENMKNPTHEKVFTELILAGYRVYNTRGVEGEFYRGERRRDLMEAAQEVLAEKSV